MNKVQNVVYWLCLVGALAGVRYGIELAFPKPKPNPVIEKSLRDELEQFSQAMRYTSPQKVETLSDSVKTEPVVTPKYSFSLPTVNESSENPTLSPANETENQ